MPSSLPAGRLPRQRLYHSQLLRLYFLCGFQFREVHRAQHPKHLKQACKGIIAFCLEDVLTPPLCFGVGEQRFQQYTKLH